MNNLGIIYKNTFNLKFLISLNKNKIIIFLISVQNNIFFIPDDEIITVFVDILNDINENSLNKSPFLTKKLFENISQLYLK